MDTIKSRRFSLIEDAEVRRSLVQKEERDMHYDIEHEEVERDYEQVIFNGKTIHGTKL